MSAAATAAGYLYASGRLRGRAQRDQEHHDDKPAEAQGEKRAAAHPQRPRIERPRQEVRVVKRAAPAGYSSATSPPRAAPPR